MDLSSVSTTTIGDFMTRRVETISAASSVQEVAKKMKDKDISSLVVVDDRLVLSKVSSTKIPFLSIPGL